jgi:hypothetical protein
MVSEITREALLAAGYREYPPCFPHQGAVAFFQKLLRDSEHRNRYFININEYHVDGRVRWHPEMQFETQADRTVDISVMGCESVKEIEDLFERTFVQLNGKGVDE